MVKILKSEIFKINRAGFLKVIIFLTLFSTFCLNLVMFKVVSGQPNQNLEADLLSSFKISIDFYIPIYIICLLFACMYLGMDFEDKIIKNILAVGKSRFSYLFSKTFIAIYYFTIIYFIYIFSAAISHHYFFGIVFKFDNYQFKIRMIQTIFLLLQLYALICMTTMIAFITKSASYIIICSFMCFISEYILSIVILNNKTVFVRQFYKYTLSGVREALLLLDNEPNFSVFSSINIFLVPIIYSIIFVFLGFCFFEKTEIN